jgi:hypothetical protein
MSAVTSVYFSIVLAYFSVLDFAVKGSVVSTSLGYLA